MKEKILILLRFYRMFQGDNITTNWIINCKKNKLYFRENESPLISWEFHYKNNPTVIEKEDFYINNKKGFKVYVLKINYEVFYRTWR